MDIWRFSFPDASKFTVITGEYNYFIVGLSIAVSTLAAFALITVFQRMWETNTIATRKQWRLFGCVVFGLGVWAMHFTGMLAFMLPTKMEFNVPITVLSVFPPMVATHFSAKRIATQQFTPMNIQLSALYLALGIGSMHFVGMEAMEMDVLLRYDLALFILSIFTAHILAVVAIYLVTYLHKHQDSRLVINVACAFIMGLSIAGMHYVAMKSAHFFLPSNASMLPMQMNDNPVIIAMAITTMVFVIVATTILGSIFDKRLQAAEHTAKVSATREKDIVENLADGLLILEENGDVVSMNSMGVYMFQYKDTDKITITSLIPSFDMALLNKGVNQRGSSIQFEGKRQNGHVFPVEISINAMSYVPNTAQLYNCVVRDVTSRVELEDQLRQAQKLESIGQLAAGIAHEINTPTQYVSDNAFFLQDASKTFIPILTLAQRIASKNNGEDEDIARLSSAINSGDIDFLIEEIPLALEQSVEGLQRISKIVSAMKSFSHTSGVAMQHVDISEAISSTIIVARSEWRYVAKLTTDFDPSMPPVMCLRDEFNQVILNCIVNAAHAIEEKFGKDEEAGGSILIATQFIDNAARVSISDNGIGMSESVKNKIFDPFYTTKGIGKGTGQGLSMAYAVIVEKHHGKIEVDSTPGQGTSFTIILPIEQPQTGIS